MGKYIWKTCMDCKKKMKKFRRYKNLFLCYTCFQKRVKIIGKEGGISLEKALSKTYKISGYLNKKGRLVAQRSFPPVLIGHKIKIELCDNDEK